MRTGGLLRAGHRADAKLPRANAEPVHATCATRARPHPLPRMRQALRQGIRHQTTHVHPHWRKTLQGNKLSLRISSKQLAIQ